LAIEYLVGVLSARRSPEFCGVFRGSGPVCSQFDVRVHSTDVPRKGYVHHASPGDPQYEIKSGKTDHIALPRPAH
jgi:hypothetical protein